MDRHKGRDVETGQLAPNFTIHNGNNSEVTLIDFRGKTLLLMCRPFEWPGLNTVELIAVRRVAE